MSYERPHGGRMAWKQRKTFVTREISPSEAKKEGITVYDEDDF